MDDLRSRLTEAADQAAQLARGPGPAAALRRARARRRRRAGEALLAVAMVAAVVATGRGGLVLQPEPPARWRHDLVWQPLAASEWRAPVPGERPLDPILVAAQGERAGEPWRLVVYRSSYRPAGSPRRVADVCYLLEWFAMDPRQSSVSQVHGTCAPAAQPSAVLAVNGPGSGRGVVTVIGRAPENADRVRLELRGRAPVETATVRPEGASLGRFYVAFVPRAGYLERMVALDGGGNHVGEAPGQGDLSREVPGFPPTGPLQVVASVHAGAHGTVEILAWPVRDGYCMSEQTVGGAGSSLCESTSRGLAPRLSCSGSLALPLRLVYGGVPRAARTVTVQAAKRRVEVPARDVGAPFDRAFFATVVSNEPPREPLVVTAHDGQGKEVWSRRLPWRCG